jgi:hypothetical protein
MAAEKEGNITLPKWNPKDVLDHTRKPPSESTSTAKGLPS